MQVARVFGTPVRIDASWLFIFALLVWTLSSAQGTFAMATPQWRIAASIVTVIALFACVVAHELAHVAVARSYEIHTVDIVLFAFGGVSRMEKVGATPAAEAQISVAGPALSLCLGVICAVAAPIFPANSVAFGIVTYLAIINVALAAFNFFPAYPMDGGRLVHALAWRITRDRLRATRLAVKLSTGAGALMGAVGLALLFTGYVVDGVWIALLSWFIIRSAQTEYTLEAPIGPLASVRCADLVDPPSRAFQPDMTCAEALAQMIGMQRRAVPIAVGRRLLGIVTLNDFAKLGTSDANYVYVSAIMTPVAQLQKLAPDLSGSEAFNELASSGHPQLPVVDQNGTLLGFITRETLARSIEKVVK